MSEKEKHTTEEKEQNHPFLKNIPEEKKEEHLICKECLLDNAIEVLERINQTTWREQEEDILREFMHESSDIDEIVSWGEDARTIQLFDEVIEDIRKFREQSNVN